LKTLFRLKNFSVLFGFFLITYNFISCSNLFSKEKVINVNLNDSILEINKWSRASGPLLTRWSHEVSPDNELPDYPRPQMVRSEWQNLNGLWDYCIARIEDANSPSYQGKILVPFPLESALSGVMKKLKPDELLWYRRTFRIPRKWRDRHVLLHFGSVDWQADVFVNGKLMNRHKGGYDPFSIDITDALETGEEQELVVRVLDPTDLGSKDNTRAPRQPLGKQSSDPNGIVYSQVSGIWKTVWMEPISSDRIEKYVAIPDIDQKMLIL
jgi:hypothetical protein